MVGARLHGSVYRKVKEAAPRFLSQYARNGFIIRAYIINVTSINSQTTAMGGKFFHNPNMKALAHKYTLYRKQRENRKLL